MIGRLLVDLVCAAAASLLLGAVACGAASPPSETSRDGPQGEVLPGPDLGPEDEIDGVDLRVERDGRLHVVWREVDRRPGGTGLPEYRTLYLQAARDGAGWSGPEALPFRAPPRLVLSGGRPHALAGRRLELARRADDGAWERLGRLLPEELPDAAAFDVAGAGDGFLVALLARRGADGPLRMVTFGDAQDPPLRRLAEHPPSPFEQPEPCLVVEGWRAHLLWAINTPTRAGEGRGVGVVGRVFYAGSDDGGATWSPPVEVTAAAPEPPSTIAGVELVRDGDGLLSLYASFGLHASASVDGGEWSVPVRFSGISGSSLRGGTEVRSPATAGNALVWIDQRHRESDRRWWNPLGGFPWSDSPDWADNDLLLLPLDRVRRALEAPPGAPKPAPRRLTPELAYVHRLRAASSPERVYLLWSGRHPVGKARDSRGATPQLFLHRLPRR